jgi:dienelactone hydrolase
MVKRTRSVVCSASYVDPDRVGLLGFSMGGGAVLVAIAPGLIANKKSQRFRAAVAYYP